MQRKQKLSRYVLMGKGKFQGREYGFQHTSNNEAHGPGEDAVAGLPGRHLTQHGHRDGLDVERKRDRAHGRRECVCATSAHVSMPHQHQTCNTATRDMTNMQRTSLLSHFLLHAHCFQYKQCRKRRTSLFVVSNCFASGCVPKQGTSGLLHIYVTLHLSE